MIVAKEPKCAEGYTLAPFTITDCIRVKATKKTMARCQQCRKYRCLVEVVEK